MMLDLALGMYANEPCRICGKLLLRDDLKDAVFAGYSKKFARAAHGQCWTKNIPKPQWAYPDDDTKESRYEPPQAT